MAGKPNPPKKARSKKGSASSGDSYELSGDFRGAVVNIKSTIVSNADVKDIENLPPEPGEPPFQGLQYFDEKDADRFFGREAVVARIVGRPLDRSRPLWETYVLEGLPDGRFGILTKVHHATIDGASGALMLAAILDTDPDYRPVGEPAPWVADPPGTRFAGGPPR